ncbi:MAG: site-2 protease family protein [Gemmatimonadetes bacterium]|nr:site-2 protease family protein [Gemmatimonadota bacterium]
MENFLLVLPVLLFSMVAHEYAHGYAALKQGDPTALMLGRLTFNPAKHIDPWMTILLPLLLWFGSNGRFVFGGAKPVPVNPRNYRHYRRGDIIVSSAGIVANLILAVVFLVASVGIGLVGERLTTGYTALVLLQRMAFQGIWLNLLLAFFNLIPIPPLDGSHLFYHLLPPAMGARYRSLSPYGLVILPLLLVFMPGLFPLLLFPAFLLQRAAITVAAPYALQALSSW